MTVNFFMGKYIIVIVLINFYNPFLIPHDYYPFKWFPLPTSPASPGRNLTFTRGFKCVLQQPAAVPNRQKSCFPDGLLKISVRK